MPSETERPSLDATFEPTASAPPGALEVRLGTCCRLAFVPTSLTLPAGRATLFLINPVNPDHPFDHDIRVGPEIGRALASSPVLKNGETGIWTIDDLPPGSYAYWCSVNQHYQQGMFGTLTVTP